jgi:signal transduction histidine kinase/CheY-like chemotaxis protein
MKNAASIRQRLLRVVMTTTLVALLLSATALLLYELQTHRATWAQDLQTQADLVARASVGALGSDDRRLANENLALLSQRPQIEAAALYDAAGGLFASDVRAGQRAPAATLAAVTAPAAFYGDTLELLQPVVQGGQRLGTLLLRAHYDVLPRLLDYLAILGLVTLASLGLAWMVAQRLQSAITDPIVAVCEVAREVVQHRNFALRAPRTTDDEVGALVDAFNDMLQELGTQAAELQATDRRKDEFLATLAHELRNPLAPVSTALVILSRGEADPATQTRLVAMMQRQMQQFVRLIDDLMEVSRISTGRLALRLERLDLVEVLRGAVESVAPLLLERRHTLQAQWPPPVWVQGDGTRLGQIFVNLLGNAAKYTEPGGRIVIALHEQPGSVEVQISDNGIGIAPEMQREVFEMFVQIDRAQPAGRAGLGVGLSLARQLVHLHQGSLALSSAGLGQGSTFSVRLPRPAEAEAAAAAAVPPSEGHAAAVLPPSADAASAPTPTPAPTPLRVLLADDNRDFTDSLAAVLKGAGHRVEVTYDGHGALRAAHGRLPDVGLFDLGMPGLDGYALASAVRGQPGGDACLLVAITGWGQQSDKRRGHAAGYDEVLVKPVDIDSLLDLLARRQAGRAQA